MEVINKYWYDKDKELAKQKGDIRYYEKTSF